MTGTQTLEDVLRDYGACKESSDWADSQDWREAWDTCRRGDWLLWIATKVGVDRKLVVLAACACARRALRFVPQGESRPLAAIEAAEQWTRGEATLDEVLAAGTAVEAAEAAAEAAAWAAARTAEAGARAAAEAAAWAAELKACADTVRSIISYKAVLAAHKQRSA